MCIITFFASIIIIIIVDDIYFKTSFRLLCLCLCTLNGCFVTSILALLISTSCSSVLFSVHLVSRQHVTKSCCTFYSISVLLDVTLINVLHSPCNLIWFCAALQPCRCLFRFVFRLLLCCIFAHTLDFYLLK